MPIVVVDGPIIAAGMSLSSAVDLSAGKVVRITTPAQWTPANLSFQISSDGIYFNDVFDARGREFVIVCGPARGIIVLDPNTVISAAHLKFRSGTSRYPVAQQAQREFAVAIETP